MKSKKRIAALPCSGILVCFNSCHSNHSNFANFADKNPNNKEAATEKFQQISEAYEILIDPHRRSEYDMYGRAGGAGAVPYGGGRSAFASRQFHDPFEVFREFFGINLFAFQLDRFALTGCVFSLKAEMIHLQVSDKTSSLVIHSCHHLVTRLSAHHLSLIRSLLRLLCPLQAAFKILLRERGMITFSHMLLHLR